VLANAFSLDAELRMRVGERDLPEPAAGDVVVRVEWAGLCGSDLHVMRGGAWVTEWPATLGHELYGRVESAPAASGFAVGTAVVADSRIPCGACAGCATDPDACSQPGFLGEIRPGAFATRCSLPPALLHPVPETLDGATAVLAEPLAVVLAGLGRLSPTPSSRRVAILGHGPIGALAQAELRRREPGWEIAVAEPAALRASLGRALGARTVPAGDDLPAAGFDLVIDAAGHAASLTDALRLAAPGAQILVLAISEAAVSVRPIDLVERALTVFGSNAFRAADLRTAIELLAREGWRYAPVVTDAIALDELPEVAARQLRAPDAIKVLIRP